MNDVSTIINSCMFNPITKRTDFDLVEAFPALMLSSKNATVGKRKVNFLFRHPQLSLFGTKVDILIRVNCVPQGQRKATSLRRNSDRHTHHQVSIRVKKMYIFP